MREGKALYNLSPNLRTLSKIKCVHASKISFSDQEKILLVRSSTRGGGESREMSGSARRRNIL